MDKKLLIPAEEARDLAEEAREHKYDKFFLEMFDTHSGVITKAIERGEFNCQVNFEHLLRYDEYRVPVPVMDTLSKLGYKAEFAYTIDQREGRIDNFKKLNISW